MSKERVLQELAVGACMKRETRVEVAEQLSRMVETTVPVVDRHPVAQQWKMFLVDWHHSACGFDPAWDPGDPLADLTFFLAFSLHRHRLRFLLQLAGALGTWT